MPKASTKVKETKTGARHVRTPSETITRGVRTMAFGGDGDGGGEPDGSDNDTPTRGSSSKVAAKSYHVSDRIGCDVCLR
jgi:hypothetical protein